MPRAQLDAERTENSNLRLLLEASVPVARHQALEDDAARLRKEARLPSESPFDCAAQLCALAKNPRPYTAKSGYGMFFVTIFSLFKACFLFFGIVCPPSSSSCSGANEKSVPCKSLSSKPS